MVSEEARAGELEPQLRRHSAHKRAYPPDEQPEGITVARGETRGRARHRQPQKELGPVGGADRLCVAPLVGLGKEAKLGQGAAKKKAKKETSTSSLPFISSFLLRAKKDVGRDQGGAGGSRRP